MIPGPRLIGPLYKPGDVASMVGVDANCDPGKTFRLTSATAVALRTLRDAAVSAGFKLRIVSGYRSPEHQAKLFADAVLRYGGEAKARKWVAKFSEHATGQTVDFNLGIANSSENALGGKFDDLPVWRWLSRAAHQHGWTPYEREPWHWTFNPVELSRIA